VNKGKASNNEVVMHLGIFEYKSVFLVFPFEIEHFIPLPSSLGKGHYLVMKFIDKDVTFSS